MSKPGLSAYLSGLLQDGAFFLGEVRLDPDLRLCHRADTNLADLPTFTDPYEALEIVKYDEAGKYRPLKTAPNLRRGWVLQMASIEDMRLALDFIYPGALAALFRRATLPVTPLRETLARQSGMYAVVRRLTDEQAEDLVRDVCSHRTGCLREILWPLAEGGACLGSVQGEISYESREFPLLCAEGCNLLVAAGRKVVKAAQKAAD